MAVELLRFTDGTPRAHLDLATCILSFWSIALPVNYVLEFALFVSWVQDKFHHICRLALVSVVGVCKEPGLRGLI